MNMLVAGVCSFGGKVEMLEVDEPRSLAADEVLIEVRGAGIGNWDNIVRTGDWDVDATPPMALGVEAAGVVKAVGAHPSGFSVDDEVLCHPVPLRDQGTWAPFVIAPAGSLAGKPTGISWEIAGVFPVPALTAEQVVGEALALQGGETLLVNGAGGITGGLIVQLAALRGVRGAPAAMTALADGGRLATITPDPPAPSRGISVTTVYVRSDGTQLIRLVALLDAHRLDMPTPRSCSLDQAASALAEVVAGRSEAGSRSLRGQTTPR